MRGQLVRKQDKLVSENTWFRVLVRAMLEKEQQLQSRLGSDKVQGTS